MKYYEQESVSLALYEHFGISEWKEKCVVLKEVEIEYILKHLGEENNELVELVKQPFPKFVEIYFKQFKERLAYVENPQFGYNLFLLNEGQVRLLMEYLRMVDRIPRNLINKVKPIIEDLFIPFDSALKINKTNPQFKKHEFQKAYISQYIDKKEAERLKLTHRTFYENGEYKDFDLQGKLNCLNGVTKEIFNYLLGMEGRHRLDLYGVSEKFEISEKNIKTLADISSIPFTKTLKEFQNAIGYQESDEKGFHVYLNPAFLNADFNINYLYYIKKIINISDINIINNLNYTEAKTYIASKYFYSSVESVRKALKLKMEDAAKFEKYIPELRKKQK